MPDILNRLEALCETANCFGLDTVGAEAKAAIAEITQLRAQVEELTRQRDEAMKDAGKWREHEAKKMALIERGFLRSPLRSDDAAIQGSKKP